MAFLVSEDLIVKLLAPLAIVLIVAVTLLVLRVGEARKRAAEAAVRDVAALKPRKHSLHERFDVPLSPGDALARLAEYAESRNARIRLRDGRQLLAFTGSAGDSKFQGMMMTPPMSLPLRIAAVAETAGGSTSVRLLLDEDYGFQKFLGPAKRAFAEKYREALERTRDEIRSRLDAPAA